MNTRNTSFILEKSCLILRKYNQFLNKIFGLKQAVFLVEMSRIFAFGDKIIFIPSKVFYLYKFPLNEEKIIVF